MSKVSQYVGLTTSVLGRIVRPRISRVTIPVTYNCNQKCKTCGIWSINRESPELRKEELTLEEFKMFCQTNNLLWIAFTGGEPFLRRDMSEIMSTALSHARFVSITTNGSLPDKVIKDTKEALGGSGGSITMSVSFNGPEAVHNEISGVKNSYKKAYETFSRLREITNSRLRIGISYTTSGFNSGQLFRFIEEFGEPLDLTTISYVIAQDSPSYFREDRAIVPPLTDEITELVKAVLPHYKVGNLFDFIGRRYLEGLLNGRKQKCVAGQYNLMLDPYWNVYPCMFFCPTNPIGNLRELDFDLSRIDYEKCKELVRGCKVSCWTPCEAYPTMLFRPWRAL